MSPSLTLHIGPGKTGTTSIQTALLTARDELAAQGVVIPPHAFTANGHLAAAFDYLCTHPDNVIPVNARGFLHAIGDTCAGSWDRLVATVQGSTGPVIVSQEVLACLNSAGAADLAATFARLPVRAVAMFRPVSDLIPSLYQQEARLMMVPPFEEYVRRCVTMLVAGGSHEFLWMDTSWLRETWEGAGIPLEIVDAGDALTPASLAAMMAALLPTGVPAPAVARENPGLSAYGVDVWRAHLRDSSPTHLIPALRVLDTFCAVDTWATDRELGGRYVLADTVADLLDVAFPCASRGGQAGATVAAASSQDRRREARGRLSQLLANGAPLTQRIDGSGTRPQERAAHARASLARRQRQDDLIWAVGRVVRRAQGRPAPIKADWAFDARQTREPERPPG
ncbi:MAG: hypothetical protein ACH36H_09725 [Candidatus Nanopelagicales bacterium]